MIEKTITFDRFVRWMLGGLLAGAILLLINYLSNVLLPFVVAWLFAYLLYPIVKFVQYRMHVPGRVLSIIVTLLFVLILVSGVIYLIIPPMIEQFQKLGQLATDYIQKSAHISDIPKAIVTWFQNNQQDIENFFRSRDFTEGLKLAMPKLFDVLGQTANIVISIVASMITLLYMIVRFAE